MFFLYLMNNFHYALNPCQIAAQTPSQYPVLAKLYPVPGYFCPSYRTCVELRGLNVWKIFSDLSSSFLIFLPLSA